MGGETGAAAATLLPELSPWRAASGRLGGPCFEGGLEGWRGAANGMEGATLDLLCVRPTSAVPGAIASGLGAAATAKPAGTAHGSVDGAADAVEL